MPDTYLLTIYIGTLQPLSLLRIWVGIKSKAHYQPGYHSNSNGFYKGICFHWLQANTKQVFKKARFCFSNPHICFWKASPRRIVATFGLPDYLKGKVPWDLVTSASYPPGLRTWPFPMLVQWVASIHGWSIAPIRGATVEDGAWARHAGAALHGSFVFHGRPCGGNF